MQTDNGKYLVACFDKSNKSTSVMSQKWGEWVGGVGVAGQASGDKVTNSIILGPFLAVSIGQQTKEVG